MTTGLGGMMTDITDADRKAAEIIHSVISQEAGLHLVLGDKDWLATVIADSRSEPSQDDERPVEIACQ